MLEDRRPFRPTAHRLWHPHAGGAALVVGLHGVVLTLALALDVAPARTAASQPIEVRLIAPPQRLPAAVPEPPVVAVRLAPPAALPTLPIPDFAIQTAAAPATPAVGAQRDVEPQLAVAAAQARPAAAAPATAEPAQIRQVAYARFDPPEYPPLSRRLGESGVVVLRVLIDEQGVPREVQVETSSGFARLDEAAIAAVRRARFVPHSEGGRTRAAVARVPIRFELT
jgi:protein TonB